MTNVKPRLHYLVRKASHFARWERLEFGKYFDLVDEPSPDAHLISFGPDVLEEARTVPALKRFAVMFPGFSHNPVRDPLTRRTHLDAFRTFSCVFINPGPLEIAYRGLDRLVLYPFSIDTESVGFRRHRTSLSSLVHVSHDNPQKDWPRSESIMVKSGLRHEVFPPRSAAAIAAYDASTHALDQQARARGEVIPLASRPGTSATTRPSSGITRLTASCTLLGRWAIPSSSTASTRRRSSRRE